MAYDSSEAYVLVPLSANGQELVLDGDVPKLVQGQLAKVAVSVEFSGETWEGLNRYARFRNALGLKYDVALNKETQSIETVGDEATSTMEYVVWKGEVPHEVTDDVASFDACLWGEDEDGRKLTTNYVSLDVGATIPGDGGEPEPATPSLLTQVIAAAATANEAASTADAATRLAEAATEEAKAAAETAEGVVDSGVLFAVKDYGGASCLYQILGE